MRSLGGFFRKYIDIFLLFFLVCYVELKRNSINKCLNIKKIAENIKVVSTVNILPRAKQELFC